MKKIGGRNDERSSNNGYGYNRNNNNNNNDRYNDNGNNNNEDDENYSNEDYTDNNNNNNNGYDRYNNNNNYRNQQGRYKRKAESTKLHAQNTGNEWQQYPEQSFNNNNNDSGRQSNGIATDKSCIVQCFFHEMKLVCNKARN